MNVNLNVLVRNIIILIVLVAVVILIICVPNSGDFSPDVTENKYKQEKNAEELKNFYEQEGNKEKFLADISNIQNAVSMALLNDDIVNDNQLTERISEINKVLKKEDWSMLNITIPTFWVGTWSVDSTGTVKFTFINNNCIPNWANDEDVRVHIVFN